MSLKKCAEYIRKNNSFLITSHTSAEPDALGSELALYLLLKRLKKRAVIVNDETVPAEYAYIRGTQKIKTYQPAMKKMKFDCFCIVDCSSLSRCGRVSSLARGAKVVLNIDHHISNSFFAGVNWVDAQVSSASEMVYHLFRYMRVKIDPLAARLLYLGILTDTGSFRYTNTTAGTHLVAAELLKYGLDAADIYKEAYSNIPFPRMKLLGAGLSGVKRGACGKLVWLRLKKSFCKNGSGSFDLGDQLLTLMRAIKGVEVAVLFREDFSARGEVRVNLRSQGRLDVNRVAAQFGGGGHRTASGCTIKGTLQKAETAVLAKIREKLRCG